MKGGRWRNGLLHRLHSVVVRDIAQFRAAVWSSVRHSSPLHPGLYAFSFDLPEGKRRVHLRVEADGSGVLFSNVNRVVHLNSTATTTVKMALDATPKEQARAVSLTLYGRAFDKEAAVQLDQMYEMVRSFNAR